MIDKVKNIMLSIAGLVIAALYFMMRRNNDEIKLLKNENAVITIDKEKANEVEKAKNSLDTYNRDLADYELWKRSNSSGND